MPICPFIQGDLHTGNIKFMVYNSSMDTTLIDMVKELILDLIGKKLLKLEQDL